MYPAEVGHMLVLLENGDISVFESIDLQLTVLAILYSSYLSDNP